MVEQSQDTDQHLEFFRNTPFPLLETIDAARQTIAAKLMQRVGQPTLDRLSEQAPVTRSLAKTLNLKSKLLTVQPLKSLVTACDVHPKHTMKNIATVSVRSHHSSFLCRVTQPYSSSHYTSR